MFMMALVGAAGLVWLVHTFRKGLEEAKARWAGLPADMPVGEKLRNCISFTTAWKDTLVSLGIIFVGSIVFQGVMGMIVGLIASVMLSIYFQVDGILTTQNPRKCSAV